MPAARDLQLHHLLALRDQYRSEADVMARTLGDLREEVERCQRQRMLAQLWGEPVDPLHRRELTEVQDEHDRVAMELAHIRLAVLGVQDEIATAGPGERLSA
ncbi:MAG: hypothetical protein KDE27_03830 [Planctomycetes bacterium]|nr:hypothetical protein [Planctomycetota bacterium]